jgi:hypothetical protein
VAKCDTDELGYVVAASDDLMELAQRARLAEDRVAAARSQARSDVEQEVARVRDAAQRKPDQLQAQTATAAAGTSQWWSDVQRMWSGHVARIREDIGGKKAEMDAKVARRRGDVAEDDAVAAVAFAESALEEAEYAVLSATLARMDADAAAK